MADRDLKRLSRSELLELLVAQSRENDRLQKRITELEARLFARGIELKEAGSIAEAALRLNGVFEAAQKAADQYVENVRLQAEQAAQAGLPAADGENEEHGK